MATRTQILGAAGGPERADGAPSVLRWVRRRRGAPAVICFPHAGGTILSCARLAYALPDHINVAAVVLPGHDPAEPGAPVADARRLAGMLAEAIVHCAGEDDGGPLVLLGNSFGALLAFEVAQALERLDVPASRGMQIIVSGFRSPSLPPCDAPLHRLPRGPLLAELRERFGQGGFDHGAEHGSELGAELGTSLAAQQEAALRADLQACETYRPGLAPPLRCTLSVIRLLSDTSVSADELEAWREVCAGPVRFLALDAGHFPWTSAAPAFTALLTPLIAVDAVGKGEGAPGPLATVAAAPTAGKAALSAPLHPPRKS
ncbi:thioesterase II family protein [Xanthobacter agilis]|uniref:thioesterase II family protein n=1 Tax=Xanthobacter agilis TaxID=47492 RepID=UPI003727DA26